MAVSCGNCSTRNPDAARFCNNCGQILSPGCPNCDAENPAGAKFCNNCGHRLAPKAEPAPEVADKLTQYIPQELLNKLEAARSGRSMVGERRAVTILFCDVEGSTAVAETLDPEDWAEIMNGAFEHLIAPVYRYEGTLARLMGDAVLAFFGAPITHEDDPERAILAGLEIIAGIEEYRAEVQSRWGLEFDVRVGINTGLVVVGEVGSDLRMEYTAMGDAVNLAARMEQTARPGSVQISEETYRRVRPLFEFEDLGGVKVKGKAGTVPAYRVLGRKASPGRLRGIEGLEAPLIGRESEMARLEQVLTDLAQGRGGIVSLIGEAGLGKSRLIEELKVAWHQKAVSGSHLGESRGVSYESAQPYGQFGQHIRQLCGIGPSEPARDASGKLKDCISPGDQAEPDRAVEALQLLLGMRQQSSNGAVEGEEFRRQLMQVMRAVWAGRAAAGPVVLVFDDLHWADSASIELLLDLLALAETHPVLFLCAFRPHRQDPCWRVKTLAETDFPHRYTEIALQPLSAEGSRALVDNLLTISELPPRLQEIILERAEGNPFFVEEVVRSLIDGGAIVREEADGRWKAGIDLEEIVIPDNLQALLLSRMDRLEEDPRRTLQLASVIGRSFLMRVLKSIAEAMEHLEKHLATLERMELIREASRSPELQYAFQHALTHETAYRSILRKHRRVYHQQVADSTLALFPDRLEEFAPVLAHHLLEAEDPRALEYLILSGDQAFRLYALREAQEHYRRAADLLKDRTEAPEAIVLHVFTRLGRTHELRNNYRSALGVYAELQSLGEAGGQPKLALAALMASATVHSIPNPLYDLEMTRTLSDRAIALANELGDSEAEARILWNRMNSEHYSGEVEQAKVFGERSLEIARRLELRNQLAFTLNDLPLSYIALGEIDSARAVLREAERMWEDSDNQPMLADNLSSQSFVEYWAGNYGPAIEFADRAYAIADAVDNTWGKTSSLGWVGIMLADQGQVDRGLAVLREAYNLALQSGHPFVVMAASEMGIAYGALGDPERGIRMVEEAALSRVEDFHILRPLPLAALARLNLLKGDLAAAKENLQRSKAALKLEGSLFAPDYLFIARGMIALAEGEPPRAIDLLDELLELLRMTQRRPHIPEALLVRATALSALGDLDAAVECLQSARSKAQALGSRRMLWRIGFALSRAEAARGNAREAEASKEDARSHLDFIADHIADVDLRQRFLQTPEAAQLLSA